MPANFIGDSLLSDIRETISTVRNMPGGESILRIPTRFDGRIQSPVFRICTFTGAWSKNSDKTVTFKNQTTTPNTVSAQNLFISLPGSTASSSSRTCGIARDGTAWHLIQWEWEVTDVLSGASLGTAALEFTRVNAPYLATAATVQISVTTCSTAAS
jgi:hypothetical protein